VSVRPRRKRKNFEPPRDQGVDATPAYALTRARSIGHASLAVETLDDDLVVLLELRDLVVVDGETLIAVPNASSKPHTGHLEGADARRAAEEARERLRAQRTRGPS
jgi:hypothetical protein